MKNQLFYGSVIGFVVVCIVGSLNHFVYDWSGGNAAAAMITPVNESVWEHLKLLYFPFLFFTAAEYIVYGRHIKGFLFSKFIGVLCGMIFIPVVFYAYSIPLGTSNVLMDILIFTEAVYLSFWTAKRRIENHTDSHRFTDVSAVILFIGTALLFAGFTFYPPDTFLFHE